jgi:uncharacterized protein (TIGR00661 family)
MKILYGVQGTGHGHITRANEFLPRLRRYASVDVLLSAGSEQMRSELKPKHAFDGCTLVYNQSGKLDPMQTALAIQPVQLLRDIYRVDIEDYDLVISDFEPISAWAAKRAGIPSVQLSHQAAFQSRHVPRPDRFHWIHEGILKWFAPADHHIGLHYKRYDVWIEPPLIREEIKQLDPMNGNRVTVYMPSMHHRVLAKLLQQVGGVRWHIFAPGVRKAYRTGTVVVNPVSRTLFSQSMERSFGVLCNAGFETTAEALFLGKKLLVVPIAGQYEQLCNGVALGKMGVQVEPRLGEAQLPLLHQWIESRNRQLRVDAADPDRIVERLLDLSRQSFPVMRLHEKHGTSVPAQSLQVQAS